MKDPLISVIVPVYKVEKYLDFCIQSIVNQTYKNLEIILVDDGSPDNCPQLCDEWATQDQRIKVVHKENGGVSSARNRGILSASGKYIVFVDSDDAIHEDLIQQLIISKNDNDGTLVAPLIDRFVNDRDIKSGGFNYITRTLSDKNINMARYGMFLHGILFETNIIRNNELFFDERLNNLEDVLFLGLYLAFTNKVIIIENKLYFYRVTPNSITSNCFDGLWQIKCWLLTEKCFFESKFARTSKESHKNDLRFLFSLCEKNIYGECHAHKTPYSVLKDLKNEITFNITPNNYNFLNFLQKVYLSLPRVTFLIYNILLFLRKKIKT